MSGPGLTVPPGRAGRIWLERRQQAARRAADLLDRKLRILQAETRGLRENAARTRRVWDQCAAEADRALLLAALLGGERAIRLGASGGFAQVRIEYAVTIGVRHPAAGSCAPPDAPVRWCGPAVAEARRAHRKALDAAVRHAVAAEALRIIEAETATTRYRLRAVRDRLIPRLERAHFEVALAIDELERADGARLRRAASRRAASRQDLTRMPDEAPDNQKADIAGGRLDDADGSGLRPDERVPGTERWPGGSHEPHSHWSRTRRAPSS
jgi:V/A-type H+/Na+-transporting ATPase subunit D